MRELERHFPFLPIRARLAHETGFSYRGGAADEQPDSPPAGACTMPAEQLLLLAIVQGLTEFLPVSSSGHLNLVHLLTDYPDQGVAIDVAVHIGSLAAVFVYFWRDVLMLSGGVGDVFAGRHSPARRVVLLLALASIPLVVIGFILTATGWIESVRDNLALIAWTTIVFGVLLGLADRYGRQVRSFNTIGVPDAVLVGLAQCLALVPGVSRSGITMTAARGLGFSRLEAARFALLLAIPAILASGIGTALRPDEDGSSLFSSDALLAAGLSAVAAFVSIWIMMALLKRVGMMPFVVYRVALGAVLLWYAYN